MNFQKQFLFLLLRRMTSYLTHMTSHSHDISWVGAKWRPDTVVHLMTSHSHDIFVRRREMASDDVTWRHEFKNNYKKSILRNKTSKKINFNFFFSFSRRDGIMTFVFKWWHDVTWRHNFLSQKEKRFEFFKKNFVENFFFIK